VDPLNGLGRAEAIAAAAARDEGSGVPFTARYVVRPRPDRHLAVEDTGRWYADAEGRPAMAHGVMRIREAGADAPVEAPGPRERASFLTQIAPEIGEASRTKRPITMMAISLENLAELNERLGFDGGDALIRTVVARMGTVMRRRDRFAHYGGNRFALALRGCPADRARIAADRLRRAVSADPVETAQGPVQVSVLIGTATAPDHAIDAAGLLGRAERSLAAAKRGLGPGIVLYHPSMARGPTTPRSDDVPLDIINLLNARRILLARQPVVDAATRATVFSEGLLRVRGEDGAVLAAGHVIPTMERSGLVPLVDTRILELAGDHLLAAPTERLSINVSPATLDSADWLTTFAAHLGSRPGIAQRLIVEITETAAISDPTAIRKKLDAMKALGVAIAIDDFGSGHTSFKHLRNFPVDIVKIDGAFVQNLSRSANDRFFVQTLVDLAQHLGIGIVAEWVEDEETACLLAGWGVDYLQGDHCGQPALDAPPESVTPGLARPA
jgi:diguanylate cyclase (GGDEF)-like protein